MANILDNHAVAAVCYKKKMQQNDIEKNSVIYPVANNVSHFGEK